MITIAFDFDSDVLSTFHMAPAEFAREMRVAAFIHWYAQGRLSQGRAAELSGISRAEFLEELFHRKVPACQTGFEEIVAELQDA
ncbi:MAG: UPF0175 family protein [Magnetococcus sp. DMHC-1]|nr:UPF0175 family protein [Magnetococcales bacterium]